MPNKTQFDPIHESNLVPGQQYYLKIKGRGEGLVKLKLLDEFADEITPKWTDWIVDVLDGGFNFPYRRYRKGDLMTVAPGSGQWYEVKG